MAILTKKEILKFIAEDKLKFEPKLDVFQVQPHSVDLRIGYAFYVPKTWRYTEKGREALNVDYLDFKTKKENFEMLQLKPGQYFELLPEEFVLVSTLEKITLKKKNIMAILYARSSIIRRGLLVESGVIDAGYSGNLMVPILNNTHNQIIRLYPGERVCQIVFQSLNSELTEEESKKHGVIPAKYEGSTPYSLEAKFDGAEEVNLLKEGRIDELKEKYEVKTKEENHHG